MNIQLPFRVFEYLFKENIDYPTWLKTSHVDSKLCYEWIMYNRIKGTLSTPTQK